jgi:hypothetical protein
MSLDRIGPRLAVCAALLLGGAAGVAGLAPSAWAASAPIFEGQGIIELLRPTDLVGDGASPVDLYVLALAPDGQPIVGIKAKLNITGGTATDLVEKGGGLYAFTLTPAKLDAAGGALIELKGRFANRDSLGRSWTVPVAPPRNHPLAVTASPTQLTLGVDRTASITFDLGAGDPLALATTKLLSSVSTGVVANLTHLGGGQFGGLYTAPTSTTPQLALLTVVDAADPARTYASIVLPLSAKVDQTVTVAPNTRVLLKVGGREFGPVAADSKGRAKVPIVVTPGTTSGVAVQIAADGTVTERPLDLALPEARRIALFPTAPTLPADGRLQIPVRAVVVTPDGHPDEAASVVFSATAGTFSAAHHEGGGVYAAMFTPPFGNATTAAKISAKLADRPPVQTDTRPVTLVPVHATKLALTAEPAVLPASAPAFAVRAHVTGPDGAGLATRVLGLAANGARLQEVKDLKNGDYQATFTPTGKGAVEVTATAASTATGNPLAHVVLVPAAQRLPADGLSSAMLTVATLDEFGYPVPNVEVALRIVSGDGSLPPTITTNAAGVAQVFYTAGRKNGFVGIEASAGARGAGVSLVQAPGAIPLPALPVVGDAWTRAMLGELAGATTTLRVERQP